MAKIMASEGGDEDNAKIMNSNFHPVKNLNYATENAQLQDELANRSVDSRVA